MTTEDDFELEPWAVGMLPDDANFVREFMIDLNTSQTAIRCGHTPENAKKNGFRMIRRPVIAKAIAAAMQERAEVLGINAKLVLAEAFRCYLGAVEDRNWHAAAKFLDMCGRHVDVRAFRTQIGLSDPDGEPLEFDLSGLSTDEKRAVLLLLERRSGIEPGGADEGSQAVH